jgi:hypothetical protein
LTTLQVLCLQNIKKPSGLNEKKNENEFFIPATLEHDSDNLSCLYQQNVCGRHNRLEQQNSQEPYYLNIFHKWENHPDRNQLTVDEMLSSCSRLLNTLKIFKYLDMKNNCVFFYVKNTNMQLGPNGSP